MVIVDVETNDGDLQGHYVLRPTLNQICSTNTSTLCKNTLSLGKELMGLWQQAAYISRNISEGVLKGISETTSNKNEQWNTYVYNSKPMLPLDFVVTDLFTSGWKESDERYEEGFSAPPKTQFFFLHPAVGMEVVPSTIKGEKLAPNLYVEIFGANRWNKFDRWIDINYLDAWSGFSIIVSYADRAEVKEVGFGGLFTFNNTYSFGVSDYDGETGFFLSIDIANFWREKFKPQYERYKSIGSNN